MTKIDFTLHPSVFLLPFSPPLFLFSMVNGSHNCMIKIRCKIRFLFCVQPFLYQHPRVHDEVSGVSLVGLPALQALLYHCQYFEHVAISASNCYRGRYTFQLQPRAGISSVTSHQECTSVGRLCFFYLCFNYTPHDGMQKAIMCINNVDLKMSKL